MAPSRPAELLPPDRRRLMPRFETYRLRSLDPEIDVRAFPLPGAGATQSRVPHNHQQLGFKEMRARISWDHLDARGGQAVYIDTEWNVVSITINSALEPTFTTLASLPQPVSSDAHIAEFPRALPLTDSTWAVSSGLGTLYLLKDQAFFARYDLSIDGAVSPFVLYAGHVDGDTCCLLLARAVVQAPSETNRFKPRQPAFEILEVAVNLNTANGVDDGPEVMEPRWRLPGPDLPYWAVWDNGGWLILSEDPFGANEKQDVATKETRAQREARKKAEAEARLGLGARLGEEVDEFAEEQEMLDSQDEVSGVEAGAAQGPANKDFPFRWTQEGSIVTITIALPQGTLRSDINVQLKPGSVSVSVKSDKLNPTLSSFLARGEHFFWNDIRVEESTWTFDATTGELELILVKPDDLMRWPSVFVPSENDSDDEDDVPETFNPATLDAIRSSFSNAQTNNEPHGNAPTIPALLREEMDIDSDDDEFAGEGGTFADHSANTKGVGRQVVIGHVVDGKPTWSRQPATVLSLPLFSGPDLTPDIGIVVKAAVDGLLFVPAPNSDPALTPWLHLGTNPALAFVMSSKRDLRLVRHLTVAPESSSAVAMTTVFAFDSGSGAGTGNVYIYYPTVDPTSAQQGVLGVSGGERGALLGVRSLHIDGRNVVVALCERALVVLQGVL